MPERRKKKNLKSTKHHAARKTKAVVSKKKAKKVKKAPVAKKTAAEPKASSSGTLPVYDLSGKSSETLTLDPLFQDPEVNKDVIYQAVLMYQAGQRKGTMVVWRRGARELALAGVWRQPIRPRPIPIPGGTRGRNELGRCGGRPAADQ